MKKKNTQQPANKKLSEQEEGADDAFIILADVHLDDASVIKKNHKGVRPAGGGRGDKETIFFFWGIKFISKKKKKVMDKLRVLLPGLAELSPLVVVFIGNFTSKPLGSSAKDARQYSGKETYKERLSNCFLKQN